MSTIDLSKIKYYPDRFYVCLDGFDIKNLTTFITDLEIGQQQAIFIHEYYHYLTNITTFPGIRQFHLNFCDRFRIVCNLIHKEGLSAFPINANTLSSSEELIKYWKDVEKQIDEDDINYKLVKETERSHSNKFEIRSVKKVAEPMSVVVDDNTVSGDRYSIDIEIGGLINVHSFRLTFGAIDEFLSSAIDEFLYENDLSNIDPSFLSQRPFYPYGFFDALLSYYGMHRFNAFEKIIIAHFALNSFNPTVKLIEVLEKLGDEGFEDFQKDPERYLLNHFTENRQYEPLLDQIKSFADETFRQGRIHISQALQYFYDKFYTAQKLKEKDFFYFIRPFFVSEWELIRRKQIFLLKLARIINLISPPVILKDKQFFYVDKLTKFGEATMLILASYEIFESLKYNQFAQRPAKMKKKYTFPDNDLNCDNFETFQPPPLQSVFQLALNEVGLYSAYLNEVESRKAAEGTSG